MKKNLSTIQLTPEVGESYEVKIDLTLNPKKMLMIERDFPEAKHVMSLAVSEAGMELDMIQLYKVAYVAYRQANMNEYVTFDEFQDLYEFDMEEATNIFYSMLSKQFRSRYLESLQKAVKGKDSSKQ